ncbi:MAG: TrkA family potassium uptake protein [Pseudomonadota bacterium]
MHISVLGASRFGVATVEQLIEQGHEVVLIDIDKAKLDDLADGLDCAMVCGDGTLPSTLRDAYGDGSDALVTLTNEDDVNILAAVVGRAIGFDRVIPQIVRSELLSVVKELKLDDVITPHESLARSIVSGLTQHSEVDTELALNRDLRIVTHIVPSKLDGTKVGDLDLPDEARPVALASEEREVFADPDKTLTKGDRVLLVIHSDAADGLNELFVKDAED